MRDFKDDIMRPLVVRMLRNAPKTWWSILNYWGFGPESYASESDRRKWEMASHLYNLTDADATAALRDLLAEIATDRGGVWFLNKKARFARSAAKGLLPALARACKRAAAKHHHTPAAARSAAMFGGELVIEHIHLKMPLIIAG